MMLEATIALFVGAATPGPNNVLAMQAGTRGRRAVVRVIGGVVLGSNALIATAWLGGAALPPQVRDTLAIVGAVYLAVLGIALALGSGRAIARPASSVAAVAALQVVNPKAWIIAIAITARLGHTPGVLAALLAIGTVIPAVCLAGWAAIGGVLGGRRWIEVACGLLLIAAAIEVVR